MYHGMCMCIGMGMGMRMAIGVGIGLVFYVILLVFSLTIQRFLHLLYLSVVL